MAAPRLFVAKGSSIIPTGKIAMSKKRESLSPEQDGLARELYKYCGNLLDPSFEQWELRFSKASDSVRELTKWWLIYRTWTNICSFYPNEDQRVLLNEIVQYSADRKPTKHPGVAGAWLAACDGVLEDGM
jgi:hypothetical protein